MSAKCLLILPIEMIFILEGFANDQIGGGMARWRMSSMRKTMLTLSGAPGDCID